MSKQIVRSIKNISYSPTEVKIRNLTSNDAWGPSGADLDEVSKLTFQRDKLKEMVRILNKRLSVKKNSPLHILKSLTIIQYCLQVGSQEFVDYYRVHGETIERLIDYNILNNKSRDVINIRKRSKYVYKLIRDDKLLEEKRQNFHKLRSEMLIPGIKSRETDKSKHLRYSLDQRSNDLEEEEIMSGISGARSSSLDIKRLNYYKKNNFDIVAEKPSPQKLHLITEEIVEDPDLEYKINQLTNNPFRSTIFVDNFESLSLSGSASNSSSVGSLSDQEKRNNRAFSH